MTGRAWLLVTAVGPLRDRRPSVELRPVPDELVPQDRVAIVSWPDSGVDRRPLLAGTATVTQLSHESGTVRLRHRVAPVQGHAISVASLGPHLAVARGWWIERRAELLDAPRLIDERDFALIEAALLATAHAFGPPPKRPAHKRPRTPGRRALIAGQLAHGRLR